jgi:putative ABC transport system substrate-binding protein
LVEITADPDDPRRSARVSAEWAREQIEKYGRDNPWVLVNVFGSFPPHSLDTLIGPDECAEQLGAPGGRRTSRTIRASWASTGRGSRLDSLVGCAIVGAQMRRRTLIRTLASVTAALPAAAGAQQRATPPRIAIFHPAIPVALLTETGGGSAWRAFFGELRRFGYVEGQNLIIERYSAEGHHERYADLARQIVAAKPDLIVTGTNPVVLTFKAATSTIPLVAFMLDPLEAGLVTNLAQPGGNLTGITLDPGIEIWGKRLELLKKAIPSTARVAFLSMRDGWERSSGQFLRDVSGRLGISLISVVPQQGSAAEMERLFAAMEQQRPDGVLVSGEGDLYAHRGLIAELAEKHGLPVMCPYRDYVEAGGLIE